MKILVVDDEQSRRQVLDRGFRKDGHEVVTAENVEDALVKLNSERINVLLHRPRGENGRELIGKVNIRRGKTKSDSHFGICQCRTRRVTQTG